MGKEKAKSSSNSNIPDQKISMTQEEYRVTKEFCGKIDNYRYALDTTMNGVGGFGSSLPGIGSYLGMIGGTYQIMRDLGADPLSGPWTETCNVLVGNTPGIKLQMLPSEEEIGAAVKDFGSVSGGRVIKIPGHKKASINSIPTRLQQNLIDKLKVSAKMQSKILNTAVANGIKLEELDEKLDQAIELQEANNQTLDDVLQRLEAVEQSIADADKEEKRKKLTEQIESLHQVSSFISQLGEITNCKELKVIGTIAQAAVTIASGASMLIGAAGVLACAGPVGMIGSGVLIIVSLFMKSGPDIQEIMLQRIDNLARQIDALENKMTLMMGKLAEGQREILLTAIHGFRMLSEQNEQNYQKLDVKIGYLLSAVTERLDFLIRLSIKQNFESKANELSQTIDQVKYLGYLMGGPYQTKVYEEAQKLNLELFHWASKECANTKLNGREIIDSKPPAEVNEKILMALVDSKVESKKAMNSMLGYLLQFAKEQYQANVPDQLDIANPEIWLAALTSKIDLNMQLISIDNDPDQIISERMKLVGVHGLQVCESLANDELLWTNLFKAYSYTLAEIQSILNDYATEHGNHKLKQIKADNASKQNLAIQPGQSEINVLDFTKPLEGFTDQFSADRHRSINNLQDVQVIGCIKDLMIGKQYSFSKDPIYKATIDQVHEFILAAEFLGLLAIRAEQTAELGGVQNKSSAYVKLGEKSKPPKDGWRLPDKIEGPGGKGYVGEMDHVGIDANDWTLQLKLQTSWGNMISNQLAVQAQDLASIELRGSWKGFKGGEGIEVRLADNQNHSGPIYEQDGLVYGECVFCGEQEHGKFKGQMRDHFFSEWNNPGFDFEVANFSYLFSDNNLIRDQLLKPLFVQQRKDMIRSLFKMQDRTGLAVKFDEALIQLNIHVNMMKILAYIAGKDIEDQFFVKLVDGASIKENLDNFAKDENLDTPWLNDIISAINVLPSFEKFKLLPDAQEMPIVNKIWKNGIDKLEIYQVWKRLYIAQIGELSKYVDPYIYRNNYRDILDKMFMTKVLKDQADDIKLNKFTRAVNHLTNFNNLPLKSGLTREQFYSKHYARITEWFENMDREARFTEFSSVIDLQDFVSTDNRALLDLSLLPFGWIPSIRSMMRRAARDGDCRFKGVPYQGGELQFAQDTAHDKDCINPANMSMLLEGILAYYELVLDNPELEEAYVSSGGTLAQKLSNVEIGCKIIENLHDIICKIATSSKLFNKLFSEYLALLKKLEAFVSQSSQTSNANIYESLLDNNAATTGILDKLIAYGVWLRSYLQMCFGYDFHASSNDELVFMNMKFKLYNKRESLRAFIEKQEGVLANIGIYKEQVENLRINVLNLIDISNDINRLDFYLRTAITNKAKELLIDDTIFTKPLNVYNIGQILQAIEHVKPDSVVFKGVTIKNYLLDVLLHNLSRFGNIKRLEIRGANLTVDSLLILHTHLQRLIGLEILDLSGNNFGDDLLFQGLRALSQLPRLLPKLMYIGLRNCSLTSIEIAYLAQALQGVTTLQELDLTGNKFDRVNDQLPVLSLFGNILHVIVSNMGLLEDIEQQLIQEQTKYNAKLTSAIVVEEEEDYRPKQIMHIEPDEKLLNYRLGQPTLDNVKNRILLWYQDAKKRAAVPTTDQGMVKHEANSESLTIRNLM